MPPSEEHGCPECGRPMEMRILLVAGIETAIPIATCGCPEKLARAAKERKAEERVRDRLVASCLPPRYFRERAEGIIDPEKVHPLAVAMARRPGTGRGFVLLGHVGRGKTVAGCYVMEAWIRAGIWPCRYVSLPMLVNRWENNERDKTARELEGMRLVHVDDLGYQADGGGAWVYAFVDRLYGADVPVIWTTSMLDEKVRASLGKIETANAVMDRIATYGMAEIEGEESLRR